MTTKKTKTTTAIVPTVETAKEKTQASKAIAYANVFVVKSDEDYAAGIEEGKKIKTILEDAVRRREEITKPLNEALRSTRALFKPIEETFETALGTLRKKLTEYHKEKEAEAEAKKQKLATAVEDGRMKPETAMRKADAIIEPQKTVTTESAQGQMRTVKKWRVIDKSKIPLDFMEPDMVKIKASFRAGTPIAGVEEFEEKELAIV